MKKVYSILLVVLVFASCGSVKSGLDSSVLLKNPWVLHQSIKGNNVGVSEFAQGLPFLEFSEEGKMSGFDGCNQFNDSVDLTSEGIAIGPLVYKKACSGVDSGSFTSALNQVTGYEINGKVLELTGIDGALLSFLPKK